MRGHRHGILSHNRILVKGFERINLRRFLAPLQPTVGNITKDFSEAVFDFRALQHLKRTPSDSRQKRNYVCAMIDCVMDARLVMAASVAFCSKLLHVKALSVRACELRSACTGRAAAAAVRGVCAAAPQLTENDAVVLVGAVVARNVNDVARSKIADVHRLQQQQQQQQRTRHVAIQNRFASLSREPRRLPH